MTKPKGSRAEEPEVAAAPEEVAELVPEVAEPIAAVALGVAAVVVRKGPGMKEVPPFQWKLIGESGGTALTLFKSVEREEMDAHLDRVRKEGYYTNLRILDNNEKVVQPPGHKAAAAKAKSVAAAPKGRTAPVAAAPRGRTAPVAAKPKEAGKAAAPVKRPASKVSKPAKAASPPRPGKKKLPPKSAKRPTAKSS